MIQWITTQATTAWEAVKSAVSQAYEWVVEKVSAAAQWLEEIVVPRVSEFLQKEHMTPGEVAVVRSIGGFLGTVMAAWLVFQGGCAACLVALFLLGTSGYVLYRAYSYTPVA